MPTQLSWNCRIFVMYMIHKMSCEQIGCNGVKRFLATTSCIFKSNLHRPVYEDLLVAEAALANL